MGYLLNIEYQIGLQMLAVIESRRYTFKHNLNAALLSAVAVSGRRCVLFYSNLHYCQYDPFVNKVLNKGTLPYKPYKTLLLTKQLILCLLQNGKICRLSFEKGNMDIGCQLPITKAEDLFADKQVVLNSQIMVFATSETYCVALPYKTQNKRRILYFANPYSFEHTSFQFHNIEPICQKLDETSQLVIYFQHIQQEVEWDIKIVDLAEGTDRRIVVDNEILKPGYIVSRIILKNQGQLYMLINGETPLILILEIESNNLVEVKYKLLPNFLEVVFYNQPKQTICLSHLQHVKVNGEITNNALEIIDLNRLVPLSRVNVSLKETSMPLEKDYILDVGAEGKPGNNTIFHARHLVKKRAMIFHLIQKSGVFARFGSTAVRRVLSLFDI